MAGHEVQRYSRGSGFWIECGDPPQCHDIQDHLLAVEADPARFGLTPAFLAGQHRVHAQREAYRAAVLIAVMRNGFIRVRGHGAYTTFQYCTHNDQKPIARCIVRFLDYCRFADCEVILLCNLADPIEQWTTCDDLIAKSREEGAR